MKPSGRKSEMDIPDYVMRNLEWYIDHEHENPEYSEKVLEISLRWDI